jgi:sulfotransferase family protein
VRPLFVTGEPRCGTTLLHALLSVDPNGRALRYWEVMYPSPPAGLATPSDPRPAQADEDWRELNTKMAFWLRSHPYNDMLGNGLPEDERTWSFDFRVMTPDGAWWRVPCGMNVGGLPADATAQYRIHKMMLQHCQYAKPRRWMPSASTLRHSMRNSGPIVSDLDWRSNAGQPGDRYDRFSKATILESTQWR